MRAGSMNLRQGQTALDLMHNLNEVLVFIGFFHADRTKIFMFLKRNPKKISEMVDYLKTEIKPGITREDLRNKILTHFSIK